MNMLNNYVIIDIGFDGNWFALIIPILYLNEFRIVHNVSAETS